MVLELSTRLRQRGLREAHKVVAHFLREQTAYSREWPTDATVAASLGWSPLYRLLTRGRLRLVLEGIESRLRSPMSEQSDVPRNLTIEHLMPVSWEANWPLPDGVDEESGRERRNGRVHTIGNLTLVNQKLNSHLSNSDWATKREKFLEHSVLMLNKELRNSDEWSEDAIRGRSGRMAELISECWPGPSSSVWD